LRAYEPIPSELIPELPKWLIDEYRVTESAPTAEPDNGERTLSFEANERYSVDETGFRYQRNVERSVAKQKAELKAAAEAHDQLVDEIQCEQFGVESEEWFQRRQDDEIKSRKAELECRNEMLAREDAAQKFLDEEQQEQEPTAKLSTELRQ
jgi:hypothetical protein